LETALFVRAALGLPTLRAGPRFRNLCVNLRDLLVRHTQGMPPRNPSVSLTLRKIARFQLGDPSLSSGRLDYGIDFRKVWEIA